MGGGGDPSRHGTAQPKTELRMCWQGATLDSDAWSVYVLCMATKTISLRVEAYERLRRARLHPNESFSEVVMRAVWQEAPITPALAMTSHRHIYRISLRWQISKCC